MIHCRLGIPVPIPVALQKAKLRLRLGNGPQSKWHILRSTGKCTIDVPRVKAASYLTRAVQFHNSSSYSYSTCCTEYAKRLRPNQTAQRLPAVS